MIYLGKNAVGISDTVSIIPIDDNAGEGDTTEVWSADKSYGEISDLKSALNVLEATVNGGTVQESEQITVSFIEKKAIVADSSNPVYGEIYSTGDIPENRASGFVNIEKYNAIDITMLKYVNQSVFGIVFYSDNVEENIPSNCIVGYTCNSGASEVTSEIRHFDIPSGAKYFRTTYKSTFTFSCTGYYARNVGGLPEINDNIEQIENDVGDLSELETEVKSSLVDAINEMSEAVEEIIDDDPKSYMESLMESFKNALIELFNRTVYSDMNAKIYIMKLKRTWGPFPSDIYQQVQYVGATGTQYIMFDSLVVDSKSELAKYVYDIDFCIDSSIGNGTKIVSGFGSEGGHWVGYNKSVDNICLGTGSGCYFTNGNPKEVASYHYSIENENGKLVREDGTAITRENSTFTNPAKFCLFTASAYSNGEFIHNPQFLFTGKVYGLKLSYNGLLKLNLIPCYRKSDDVIGFYDTIGKVFYINNGTGDFTKGGDI